jgi:hypothetical protein
MNATIPAHKSFCANSAPGLKCPKCGEEDVYVRAKETYWEGDDVEAYCDSCNAALCVYASVEIVFTQPEAVDVE